MSSFKALGGWYYVLSAMSFGYKVFYHADLEPLSETDLIIEGIFGQA